jgi:putative endonuclease
MLDKRDVPLQSADTSRRSDENRIAPAQVARQVTRRQIASLGEQLAAAYLQNLGFVLICSNWRTGKFAELDLIMRDPAGTIVVIEVKTRRRSRFDAEYEAACESITWQKRRKLLIAAQKYLLRTRQSNASCRIDAVLVLFRSTYTLNGQPKLSGVSVLHVSNICDNI